MKFSIHTNNKNNSILKLTLNTSKEENISVKIKDFEKHLFYGDKKIKVNGIKEVDFMLPISPKQLEIIVFNVDNGDLELGEDNSFGFKYKIT